MRVRVFVTIRCLTQSVWEDVTKSTPRRPYPPETGRSHLNILNKPAAFGAATLSRNTIRSEPSQTR